MSKIATSLRLEVERDGVISFARFMDAALNCPNSGYYEQEENRIGRRGDFYTSVSVGPLFGQLLAFQFAEWVKDVSSDAVQWVEAGAHDGQVASDILDWLKRLRPDLLTRLQFWVVEPSYRRQQWQRATLDKFAGHVRWVESLEGLPEDGVSGVIFSNELLDAFPVHRLGWDARKRTWVEWGVGISREGFVWQRMTRETVDWSDLLAQAGFELSAELQSVLPDGFVLELCPGAGEWWRQAAAALRQGHLLTFDYGFTAREFLVPERPHGTLRAYRRHHVTAELLESPGEQDLTAHVNFTQLERAGQEQGLATEGLFTQAQFLTQAARRLWRDSSYGEPSLLEARQFQTLTHPEHLGRSFRVLVQRRAERRS